MEPDYLIDMCESLKKKSFKIYVFFSLNSTYYNILKRMCVVGTPSFSNYLFFYNNKFLLN